MSKFKTLNYLFLVVFWQMASAGQYMDKVCKYTNKGGLVIIYLYEYY